MENPGKIRKLDETVVNRIAAGEIIQRPANALKELIENCLDAKATNIQVTVKDGGLKILQIQDNGTGIRKEDMDIVCKRFTTSKLQDFDDLKTISTFGFRGEALASISHVAQLTITTKTASEKCAYKGSYIDGNLKGPLQSCAGNQGTLINVENLFYNVATRRKALSNTSEEFSLISEVVTRYAIHNPQVGFSLKKHGMSTVHVKTPHSSTKTNNIKLLFSNSVAKELIEVIVDDKNYKFKCHALVTNPNYTNKRLTLLLFINNRLVESSAIKRTIEDMYTLYLPKKAHPWVYISLTIDPRNVDVNIHPTKHEVRFLHEESIIEKIKIAIDEKLVECNSSRAFYIQSKLPENCLGDEEGETKKKNDKGAEKKILPKDMVRTNPLDQKLDKFNFTKEILSKSIKECHVSDKTDEHCKKLEVDESLKFDDKTKNVQPSNNQGEITVNNMNKDQSKSYGNCLKEIAEDKAVSKSLCNENPGNSSAIENPQNSSLSEIQKPSTSSQLSNESGTSSQKSITFKSYSINEFRGETQLRSILELRKEVEDTFDEKLRDIIFNSTFVGCVDENWIFIQSDVNLYICKIQRLLEELFYEIMLYDFCNYGIIKFSEPLPLYDLALLGLDLEEAGWTEDDGSKEELATNVQGLLLEKADMLRKYFSIVIDKKGNLKSLPILLDKYFPNQAEIPLYILRMSTEVDWTAEKPCFHDVCRETAKFYSKIDITEKSWSHVVEHVLYSAIKESLLPPKAFCNDSTILKIASLPELYKVFERC